MGLGGPWFLGIWAAERAGPNKDQTAHNRKFVSDFYELIWDAGDASGFEKLRASCKNPRLIANAAFQTPAEHLGIRRA